MEIGRMVVEFLRLMRREAVLELFGEAVLAAGPFKCQGGEDAGHGVVKMSGEPAVGTEGQDDLRTQAANAQYQVAHSLLEVGAVEFAVDIAQHLTMGDAEHSQDLANSARRSAASSSLVLAVPRLRAAVPSVMQMTDVSTPRS